MQEAATCHIHLKGWKRGALHKIHWHIQDGSGENIRAGKKLSIKKKEAIYIKAFAALPRKDILILGHGYRGWAVGHEGIKAQVFALRTGEHVLVFIGGWHRRHSLASGSGQELLFRWEKNVKTLPAGKIPGFSHGRISAGIFYTFISEKERNEDFLTSRKTMKRKNI